MNEPVTPVPKVYAAIARVQELFSQSGLAKSRDNEQQHYKFRGIDDVYNMLSTYLVDAKLIIVPRVVSREHIDRITANGKPLIYTHAMIEYDFISVEDGSKVTAAMAGEAMDSADKSSNKAMSAAYKYLCLQTFCIPTEGDNDADATTHELAPVTKQPTARPVRDDQPGMSVAQHAKAIMAAADEAELKRAFAKAWKDYEDRTNPKVHTPNQIKLKETYDKRLDQLIAAAEPEPEQEPELEPPVEQPLKVDTTELRKEALKRLRSATGATE